jgi:hypothetical protein
MPEMSLLDPDEQALMAVTGSPFGATSCREQVQRAWRCLRGFAGRG